jgi:hypothetical protein
MPGSDHILSKGFLLDSAIATAVTLGQAVILAAGPLTPLDPTMVQLAGANVLAIGLAGENMDLVKIQTGKAAISVNLMGVAKGIAGATVGIGVKVKTDANAHLIPTSTGGDKAVGIALEAAASGDVFDVLLTPGVLA